jgi:hypothetical protein
MRTLTHLIALAAAVLFLPAASGARSDVQITGTVMDITGLSRTDSSCPR